jgi:glycosyltransferase 2 family protein
VKTARIVLLLVGLAFLVALVIDNDPAAVLDSVTRLSWRVLVILVFPMALVMALDALGWRYAFPHDRVPFGTLLATRLAGEAFNIVTPTAAVGGEVVKAWLLRDRVPLEESVPAVIIAKTTITMAQGILLLLGVVLAVLTVTGSRLVLAMEWLVALEVVALSLFVVLQTRGMVGRGSRVLDRLGIRRMGTTGTAARVDAALADFYRREPRRLSLSIAFHLAAWLLGIAETWLILWFLGIPVSLTTATVIEAFGTGVRFATFVIPGSLGAQEGGYVVTFLALGLKGADGVTFGLVRRFRELVWVGIGFALFAVMRRGPVVAAAS